MKQKKCERCAIFINLFLYRLTRSALILTGGFSRFQLSDPWCGLLRLSNLLTELVKLRHRIDRVGSHIGPLVELLTGIGERHVGRYGGVDHGRGAR